MHPPNPGQWQHWHGVEPAAREFAHQGQALARGPGLALGRFDGFDRFLVAIRAAWAAPAGYNTSLGVLCASVATAAASRAFALSVRVLDGRSIICVSIKDLMIGG